MHKCENCDELRKQRTEHLRVIREQGEFIQKIKKDIATFLSGGTTIRMRGW